MQTIDFPTSARKTAEVERLEAFRDTEVTWRDCRPAGQFLLVASTTPFPLPRYVRHARLLGQACRQLLRRALGSRMVLASMW